VVVLVPLDPVRFPSHLLVWIIDYGIFDHIELPRLSLRRSQTHINIASSYVNNLTAFRYVTVDSPSLWRGMSFDSRARLSSKTGQSWMLQTFPKGVFSCLGTNRRYLGGNFATDRTQSSFLTRDFAEHFKPLCPAPAGTNANELGRSSLQNSNPNLKPWASACTVTRMFALKSATLTNCALNAMRSYATLMNALSDPSALSSLLTTSQAINLSALHSLLGESYIACLFFES
jgi:hypothetical protein